MDGFRRRGLVTLTVVALALVLLWGLGAASERPPKGSAGLRPLLTESVPLIRADIAGLPPSPLGPNDVTGTLVLVCVIDTGLDEGHPCFDGDRIKARKQFPPAAGPDDTDDVIGHGTAMAGIIGCDDPAPWPDSSGVAPKVDFAIVRVGDEFGSVMPEDVADALDWCATVVVPDPAGHPAPDLYVGADIALVGLGFEQAMGDCPWSELAPSVNAAVDAGMVVIAPAGGGGSVVAGLNSPACACWTTDGCNEPPQGGHPQCVGGGIPATEAQLWSPEAVAATSDGNVYIADNNGTWRMDRAGCLTLALPGWGHRSLAERPGGGVYVATNDEEILELLPDGSVSVLVGQDDDCPDLDGDGSPDTEADEAPARCLNAQQLGQIALAPDGSLLLIAKVRDLRGANPNNTQYRVIRVPAPRTPDTPVSYLAGGDDNAVTLTPQAPTWPARQVQLPDLVGMAVAPDGTVYASTGTFKLLRIDPDGILTQFRDSGLFPHPDTGVHAVIPKPGRLAVDRGGTLFLAADFQGGVESFDGVAAILDTADHDQLRTLGRAGGSLCPDVGKGEPMPGCGDGGPATRADLGWAADISFGPDGDLYVADLTAGRIRRVAGLPPSRQGVQFVLPDAASGRVLRFDGDGRHLATEHGLTGEPLLTFGYTQGQLTSVIEEGDAARTTTLSREDNTITITPPEAGPSILTLDAATGLLTELADPLDRTWKFTYRDGGDLLETMTTPSSTPTTTRTACAARARPTSSAPPPAPAPPATTGPRPAPFARRPTPPATSPSTSTTPSATSAAPSCTPATPPGRTSTTSSTRATAASAAAPPTPAPACPP